MIKCLLVDLDGTVYSSKDCHFVALNQALVDAGCAEYEIAHADHLLGFDGLSTQRKLDKLTQERGLLDGKHEEIKKLKQAYTMEFFLKIEKDDDLIKLFSHLSELYELTIVSNAVRETVYTILTRLGIAEFFHPILSNESVRNQKPAADMYWKAMEELSFSPKETLVIEDSAVGLEGALRSGAYVLPVAGPQDLSLTRIKTFISAIDKSQQ